MKPKPKRRSKTKRRSKRDDGDAPVYQTSELPVISLSTGTWQLSCSGFSVLEARKNFDWAMRRAKLEHGGKMYRGGLG